MSTILVHLVSGTAVDKVTIRADVDDFPAFRFYFQVRQKLGGYRQGKNGLSVLDRNVGKTAEVATTMEWDRSEQLFAPNIIGIDGCRMHLAVVKIRV